MSTDKAKIKLTIAKLIQLSIDSNRDLTIAILRSKGPIKITVDQKGKVRISASVLNTTFSGNPALDSVSSKVKNLSITLSNKPGGRVGYAGSVSFFGAASISVSGSFDLDALIMACTGLLCQAARLLKGRPQQIDKQLEQIMGY